MNVFESISNSSDRAKESTQEYAKTSLEYFKLKTFHITAYTVSLLSKLLLIGSFFAIGFVFIAIFSALALGKYFNDVSFGYLIIGVLFLIIGLFAYFLKKFIDKMVIKGIAKKLFD
jgi:ABC-type multidrug transport system fused ATPase/permease subunit